MSLTLKLCNMCLVAAGKQTTDSQEASKKCLVHVYNQTCCVSYRLPPHISFEAQLESKSCMGQPRC